ncbi:MAG: hypothetical protein LUG51_13445 [Tannerellaceae bacterium]|nr:hypothetical protein [Tannerellaceae bacterium]
MLIYVIYKTLSGYHNLAVADHFRLFLLPVFLTLFSIPYFYGLSLYIEYERLFITIKHTRRKENPVIIQKFLIAILLYANISKKRISRIWKYHLTFNPRKDDPFVYIKKAVKKPVYTIGTGSQLPIFNDIGQVLKALSGNGIGAVGEWRTFYDNTYCAMTGYFTFGKDYPPRIPNTLVYNLTGEETWIKELSLSLDIGYQQDQQEAILRFRDIVILTFQSLNLSYPEELISAICKEEEWSIEEENYYVTLNTQQFELLKNIELKLTTK